MDRKNLIINSGLIIISIFIVLFLFEISLIAMDKGEFHEQKEIVCHGSEREFVTNENYGRTFPPNSKYLVQHKDLQNLIEYKYNDEGFRDTFDTNSKDNVIILGDSFTEGHLANQNATYPHLLDRWTPDHKIRNYGTGSYGTDNSLFVYQNVEDQINHDVVVLTYYLGNDMRDNLDQRPSDPIYNTTAKGAELVSRPTNVTSDRNKLINNDFARAIIKYLHKNTRTYTFLEPRIRNLLVELGLAPSTNTPEYPDKDTIERQKSVTKGLVQELANAANNNNAELVIVTIPPRGEVRPDRPANLPTAQDAVKYGDIQRSMLINITESHKSMTYLSMKPKLISERKEGNQIYGVYNSHMVEHGYRVTAITVYEHLIDNNLINQSNTDLYEDYTSKNIAC